MRLSRPDGLSLFLLGLFWLFLVLGGCLRSLVLLLLCALPVGALVFRLFAPSPRRKKENEVFLWILRTPARLLARRRYVFMSCPLCGARLRFPRKAGAHRAHCPACDGRFPITISTKKEKTP